MYSALGCDLAAWRLAAYPWRSGPELYLRNGKRYQRNSNGYPDIFDHAHFKGVTPTMPDVSRLLKINMAAVKPEVHCISGTGRDINEIPTATPTFSTTPTSRELLPQCPMLAGYLKSIWRPSNRFVDCISELYQQSQSVI
jgi:hypothetical protein